MKFTKSIKITLCQIIWLFLLYVFVFNFHFERLKCICAVCRGEIVISRGYLMDCKIFETDSPLKNVDEIYQKFINENHPHIWVRIGKPESSTIFNTKIEFPNRYNGLEPSFTTVYIYDTSLKLIKNDLKNGYSKDIPQRYKEYLEQIRSRSNGLESELREKNKKISDLIN